MQFAAPFEKSPFLDEENIHAGPISFFGSSFPGAILRLISVSLIVFIGSWAGIALGRSSAEAAVIWPSNGLLLGLVLMAPKKRWISYLGCGVLVSVGIHTWQAFPYGKSVVFALANTVEVGSAALFLGNAGRRPDLTRPRTFFSFLLAAVIAAPILSAIVVFFGERLIGMSGGWFAGIRDWYLGDALGLGIITPCVLAMRQEEVLTWFKRGHRLEAGSLFGLLLTVPIFYQSTFPSAIVFTPLLLLILFRLGTSGGALGLLLVAGPAAYFTVRHNGTLASAGTPTLVHGIFVLQLTLAILTLEVYVIGGALGEMKRVQEALVEPISVSNSSPASIH